MFNMYKDKIIYLIINEELNIIISYKFRGLKYKLLNFYFIICILMIIIK